VLLAETSASVMVNDFTAATHPGVACTAILIQLPHAATVRFDTPGEALLRVWGRRVGLETPPAGQPIVLEHRVKVQTAARGRVMPSPGDEWGHSPLG
jgi:hypothetical protein